MAFAGTAVVGGRGEGIVVATGGATELGRISQGLAHTERRRSPLQRARPTRADPPRRRRRPHRHHRRPRLPAGQSGGRQPPGRDLRGDRRDPGRAAGAPGGHPRPGFLSAVEARRPRPPVECGGDARGGRSSSPTRPARSPRTGSHFATSSRDQAGRHRPTPSDARLALRAEDDAWHLATGTPPSSFTRALLGAADELGDVAHPDPADLRSADGPADGRPYSMTWSRSPGTGEDEGLAVGAPEAILALPLTPDAAADDWQRLVDQGGQQRGSTPAAGPCDRA